MSGIFRSLLKPRADAAFFGALYQNLLMNCIPLLTNGPNLTNGAPLKKVDARDLRKRLYFTPTQSSNKSNDVTMYKYSLQR